MRLCSKHNDYYFQMADQTCPYCTVRALLNISDDSAAKDAEIAALHVEIADIRAGLRWKRDAHDIRAIVKDVVDECGAFRAENARLREESFAAVSKIEADYPSDIFREPGPGSSPDAFSASGCRLACKRIREELVERFAALSASTAKSQEEL